MLKVTPQVQSIAPFVSGTKAGDNKPMTSRFISASHDEFDPGFQVGDYEDHINPYSGMDHDHLAPNVMHPGSKTPVRNDAAQEGMEVSTRNALEHNPNTYEHLIAYYFRDPVASHKSIDLPVHHSEW